MNRCIAKTNCGYRCVRCPVEGHDLCFQHKKIYDDFVQSLLQTDQVGGAVDLAQISTSAMNVVLPSCLDIIKCDWATDFSYAIPGLSSLITLFSQ